jgi:PAS domain S-box-containing protein
MNDRISQIQTKGNILLVDDTPNNLPLLNNLLTQKEYTVYCVTNAQSAIEIARVKPPDILLLDIKMPGMDGYETCRLFRSDPTLKDIPIIFFCILDEAFDKLKALQLLGVDYIKKPFQIEEVLARIENQLTIQHQKQSLQQEILKHQDTEKILHQFRSLIASVLNSSLDGIASTQAIRNQQTGKIEQFRCLVINPVIAQIVGGNQEELTGQIVNRRFLNNIAPHLFQGLVEVVETGQALQQDIYYPKINGRWHHVFAVKLDDGFTITIRDITSWKLAEYGLRRHERIISATMDGVFLVDRNYCYQVVNPTYLNWHLKPVTEVVGRSIADLMGSEVFTTVIKPYMDRCLMGEQVQYKAWFNYPDQVNRFISVKYTPCIELDGSISGIVANLHDVTDLKQIEMDLAEAKKAAESATKAKSEFLANMSHEIRTPMNGILGMTQVLQNTELTSQQRGFLNIIRNSSKTLLGIINDILDLSKIESGMFTLDAEIFSLEDVFSGVYSLLNPQVIAKQNQLEYVCEFGTPSLVFGDNRCLHQVLLNLVGNALKFTENGIVSVTVSSRLLPELEQYELLFAVKDTGIGIDATQMPLLFQAFTQADASTSRHYGGTGLGLSICKGLVALMGGEIWVESRGVVCREQDQEWVCQQTNGEIVGGSTFYFTPIQI